MSRALDLETTSAISGGNAQEVYNDISKALSSGTDKLLEIEFLGKSHPLPPGTNILLDGNSIGVLKAKLVQAFLVAREILFRLMRDCSDERISELQNATAVILLTDPEHLTAANTRKRLIRRLRKNATDDFDVVLRKELLLVDSYLTSRLHRHTKSPTLWGHRRWLMELSATTHSQHYVLRDLQSVVFVAAERHPKNYFAWSHMRWLTHTYICSTESSSSHNELVSIMTMTKIWCLKHPSDTSGFSFLLFCLSCLQCARHDSTELDNMCSAVIDDVLRLALCFRWTHESVWVFLRTVVAADGTEDNQRTFHEGIDELVNVCPGSQTILSRAGDYKEQCLLDSIEDFYRESRIKNPIKSRYQICVKYKEGEISDSGRRRQGFEIDAAYASEAIKIRLSWGNRHH